MIRLADIFQDNMILQREKPVPVWGYAGPGARVAVEIQGKTAEAVADEEGAWMVTLPPLIASEAETMVITVCPAIKSSHALGRDDADAAGITVCPETHSESPDIGSPVSPETLRFENIAVGEVWIAGGQSNMEFWMRYERHRGRESASCPDYRLRFYDVPKVCYNNQLKEFDYSRMGIWRSATESDLDYFSAVGYYFQKEMAASLDVPVGIIGCNWGGTVSAAWMDPETVKRVSRPWMDWFASVPEYQDMDAYISAQHGKPVNDHGNPFGDLFLETVLPVTMEYREAGRFLINLPEDTAAIYDDYMHHPQPQSVPGSLFYHMVKPLAPFAVRGVLWYQGEGDDEFGLADQYQTMLTALIGDWRGLWNDDTLPFLVVQIPGFSRWLIDFPGNNFMEIRRCQGRVCDSVPGIWLCSVSDAGEELDAHPKDKEVVGHRLALLARNHIYSENILSDPPRLSGLEKDRNRLFLSFKNVGDGLYIAGDRLEAFVISDGEKEYDFEAAADGDRLILTLRDCPEDVPADASGDGVGRTITLSFAQTSWYRVNLYNSAGIPAIPFVITADI